MGRGRKVYMPGPAEMTGPCDTGDGDTEPGPELIAEELSEPGPSLTTVEFPEPGPEDGLPEPGEAPPGPSETDDPEPEEGLLPGPPEGDGLSEPGPSETDEGAGCACVVGAAVVRATPGPPWTPSTGPAASVLGSAAGVSSSLLDSVGVVSS